MSYGYYGKILRVNLSSGTISADEHDDIWYRRYLGGAALSAYYLLKEMQPGADPLGPDNLLIMAPGVISGLPVAGTARSGIGAKSPLTGGIGKSEVGGHFNAELKHAGYDAIVFQGKAPSPVYLWIQDGVAELRDARHLWGKPVLEADEAIRADTGERLARVASIGPAGERMVRFACVIHDLKHAAGRGGMGAVMGSKNLKAVAARGKNPPPCADPEVIKAMGKRMAGDGPVKARGFHEYGTGAAMVALNALGSIPTRNFRDGNFPEVDAISAVTLMSTVGVGMDACYACSVRCKKVVKVEEPWVVDPRYGGPEYETLAAFGSNCGVDNLKALTRAHHLCQMYGMDTISAGATIAFAMECFERGYLSRSDLDGLELTWGDPEAMLKLLTMMGERQGIGDLLAEGTRRAAAKIGRGAPELAMHVKGLELGMHEPRLKQGQGLGMVVANQGGDHHLGFQDTLFEKAGPGFDAGVKPLGILEPMPAGELSYRKASFFAQKHRWQLMMDSACCCDFVPWRFDDIVALVNAATGWNTSVAELLLVGERAISMGRAFNVREGFTPADDRLPDRFFSPPTGGYLAERNQAIDRAEMAEATKSYYSLMGWDSATGVPTRLTLERLGVGWVADELAASR